MNTISLDSIRVPEDASAVERWWLLTRGQTSRSLPLEATLSYPVPLAEHYAVHLHAFYFRMRGHNGGSREFAPLALVSATYPEGRILEFRRKTSGRLFPDLPDAVEFAGSLFRRDETPEERVRTRKALFRAYEDILALLRTGQDDGEKRAAFRDLFDVRAEQPLLPYYRALNPAFFSWLASGDSTQWDV